MANNSELFFSFKKNVFESDDSIRNLHFQVKPDSGIGYTVSDSSIILEIEASNKVYRQMLSVF
jgi:hypothetical protein